MAYITCSCKGRSCEAVTGGREEFGKFVAVSIEDCSIRKRDLEKWMCMLKRGRGIGNIVSRQIRMRDTWSRATLVN